MPHTVNLPLEKPLLVPWSRFIHEPYRIGIPIGGDTGDAIRARAAHPMGKGREVGNYRIHEARYSLATARNQQLIRGKGQPVLATLDGETVGICHGGLLWVHPDHRDTGIAIEMLIELFLLVGPDRWCNPPTVRAGKQMQYSKEGVACFKLVFHELVKRGVIDPGEKGLP